MYMQCTCKKTCFRLYAMATMCLGQADECYAGREGLEAKKMYALDMLAGKMVFDRLLMG